MVKKVRLIFISHLLMNQWSLRSGQV